MTRRPAVRTEAEIGHVTDLFWLDVERNDEDPTACWLWIGLKIPKGYGKVQLDDGRWVGAHRVAYIIERGEIAEGRELDHLCRVRACVNPQHLEPVSGAENLRRGHGWAGRMAQRTECSHGHAFTDDNTGRDNRGHRYCLACRAPKPRAASKPYKKREPKPLPLTCRLGHPMSGDNLRIMPSKQGIQRLCRECSRIRDRRRGTRAEYAREKRARLRVHGSLLESKGHAGA